MNIKPLADRVLILPAPAEEKTIYLVAGGVKLLRLVLCSGKGFADRGLFLPVQLLVTFQYFRVQFRVYFHGIGLYQLTGCVIVARGLDTLYFGK